MTPLSDSAPAPWVVRRVLNFLNSARTVEDITGKDRENHPLVDAPSDGNSKANYTIGEKVAENILAFRNSLSNRRFTTLSQVDEVPGIGPDKITDLLYSFRITSAERFRTYMYDNLLRENFRLKAYTTFWEDTETYRSLTRNRGHLSSWAAEQVKQLSLERYNNFTIARLGRKLVEQAYPETYENAHYEAFAFALWFYRFDADNWFSYEAVKLACDQYLSSNGFSSDDAQLFLLKGFPNGGILNEAITVDDLPVVADPVEQSLTIWTCELYD
ncbi:MAG: hypothetical protein AAGI38_21850 [Bacteroidota bacterium]